MTDENIFKLYTSLFENIRKCNKEKEFLLVIQSGENNKNKENVDRI